MSAPGVMVNPIDNGLMDLIQSIISTQQENRAPFYVLDLGVVEALFQQWTRVLPTVRPFYTVKCNPNPVLLRALAALGAAFDCASREIGSVLALGVSPERIIYANPCKAESEIKYAASVGVNLTTFDSVRKFEKLGKWHPNCALLIRIIGTQDNSAIVQLGSKYGALPDEINPLLLSAQAAGVSFHIGSGATEFHAYESSIAMTKKVFETANLLGMSPMRVLNIGGSFAAGTLFPKAVSGVNTAIETYLASEPAGLTVMAEPERFFAATAFTLVTTIFGKRIRGDRRECWINDGTYGSMNEVIRDGVEITNIIPLHCTSESNQGRNKYDSTIYGPTLDSVDTVVNGYRLPDLEVNDWLVFPNMGAYRVAAGSSFNGFETSAILTHLAYTNPNY